MSSSGQQFKVLPRRRYGLEIWALGLGYYLFYTPYSGLTKALSSGLLTGGGRRVSGAVLLPIIAITTMAGMLGFITTIKWWQYAGRRQFFGVSLPFPRRATFLSGVCLAIIMGTTTLAFTFGGLSIVLVLVLLRGGILIIGPVVDAIVGRRVRWFSWAAMLISLIAVMIALADVTTYKLTALAIVDIAAYLGAYFFKLQFMSRFAKCEDRSTTLQFFVEEQMVAAPLLVLVVVTMGLVGAGPVMQEFRFGLTTFLGSPGAIWAAAAGFCYAGLCICTTLIFLDRRENTFCIPMHCGSSMLAGFTASAYLAHFPGLSSPSPAQTISAWLLLIALGFLSPLHHLDRLVAKCKRLFSGLRHRSASVPAPGAMDASGAEYVSNRHRMVLFVCSGNTCRSPMAAAIARAEIASRFRVPANDVGGAPLQVMSAGVSAQVGAPMTGDAKQALRQLGFEPNGHRAQQLTSTLAYQAERIFCMTESHRLAVISLAPGVSDRALRLDPHGDIGDPLGKDLKAYVGCGRQLEALIKMRLDEFAGSPVRQTD
jgi:protein-tyrosine-phosphatase